MLEFSKVYMRIIALIEKREIINNSHTSEALEGA